MTAREGLRSLSATSRRLLIATVFVSSALFMLNPFLVLGVAQTSSLSLAEASACLLVAMVLGNVLGLALSWRPGGLGRIRLGALGMVVAPVAILAVPDQESRVVSLIAITFALTLLRGAFAIFFNGSKSLHLLSNGTAVAASTIFTLVGSAFAVGSAVGPVVAVAVLDVAGYGAVYSVSSLLFACALAVIWGLPCPVGAAPPPATGHVPLSCAPASTGLVSVLAAAFCIHLLLAQVFTFLPLSFVSQSDDGEQLIAFFFTGHAALLVVLPLVVLGAMQRWLTSATTRFCVGGLLLALALVLFSVPGNPLYLFIAALLLMSLGELLATANGMELLQRRSPTRESIDRNIALYTFLCSGLGLGLGQLLGTHVQETRSAVLATVVWSFLGVGAVALALADRQTSRPSSPTTVPAEAAQRPRPERTRRS